jgi:hypothetical protein
MRVTYNPLTTPFIYVRSVCLRRSVFVLSVPALAVLLPLSGKGVIRGCKAVLRRIKNPRHPRVRAEPALSRLDDAQARLLPPERASAPCVRPCASVTLPRHPGSRSRGLSAPSLAGTCPSPGGSTTRSAYGRRQPVTPTSLTTLAPCPARSLVDPRADPAVVCCSAIVKRPLVFVRPTTVCHRN